MLPPGADGGAARCAGGSSEDCARGDSGGGQREARCDRDAPLAADPAGCEHDELLAEEPLEEDEPAEEDEEESPADEEDPLEPDVEPPEDDDEKEDSSSQATTEGSAA